MNEPTCDTCRHYGLLKQGDGGLATVCRRYPPRVFVGFFPTGSGQLATPTVTAYPSVASGDRCGEHLAQPVVAN
jgi:hypothetical protein